MKFDPCHIVTKWQINTQIQIWSTPRSMLLIPVLILYSAACAFLLMVVELGRAFLYCNILHGCHHLFHVFPPLDYQFLCFQSLSVLYWFSPSSPFLYPCDRKSHSVCKCVMYLPIFISEQIRPGAPCWGRGLVREYIVLIFLCLVPAQLKFQYILSA